MRTTLAAVLACVLSLELTAQEPPRTPVWSASIGAAVVVFPRYSGSDEYRVLPLPIAQVTFRDRIFFGPSTAGVGGGLGVYAIRAGHFDLAVEAGVQDSRSASRADALAGTDDRDVMATAGASASYRAGPLDAAVGVTRGLNDEAGVLGTARLSVSHPFGRLIATAGISAALADARQMRRDFGVTEIEASRRQTLIEAGDQRLRPTEGSAYQPDGGLRQVGLSVSLVYLLSPRWSLVGFGGVDRLSDEAAASPLVRQRDQVAGGVGLGYRF
jgi:outer membrane scaffolding protein for murein synthesis (MipA/OmpV family)